MPRRQRRKTHSGPPSQTTTPVCFRIPNKLLAVLPQVAVVKSINGKRVFTPADPEASLTTLYKNRIIDVLVSDVAARVVLNRFAEPDIPSDKLPTDLVTDKQYTEWLTNSFLDPFNDDEAAGDGAIDWTTGKFVPRKKFAAPFAYTFGSAVAPAAASTSAPAGTASPQPAGTASPQPAGTASPQPAGTASPQPAGTASPQPAGTAVRTGARKDTRKTRRERRRDAKSKGLPGSE